MSKPIRRAAFDDSEFRYVGTSRVCDECRHRIGYSHLTCAAFPDRIPEEIWNGERDHNTPYPGDGGIHFDVMTPEDHQRKAQLAAERHAWYLELKERLTAEGKLKPMSTGDDLVTSDAEVRRATG